MSEFEVLRHKIRDYDQLLNKAEYHRQKANSEKGKYELRLYKLQSITASSHRGLSFHVLFLGSTIMILLIWLLKVEADNWSAGAQRLRHDLTECENLVRSLKTKEENIERDAARVKGKREQAVTRRNQLQQGGGGVSSRHRSKMRRN